MLIKVCGMREPENLREVEMLDVDCFGFIFYEKSSRYVPEKQEYIEAIRQCNISKAGVFVNETVEKMLYKSELFQLDYIQLHGNEEIEACHVLREKGYVVIKAFAVASTTASFSESISTVAGFSESASTTADVPLIMDAKAIFQQTERYENCCDYFLFDTHCTGYGGSGKRFDWLLLDAYQGETPFLLSGGLTPDCVPDIKRLKHPLFAGIDLNSGFELYPAMKDVSKLNSFIREVR